MFNQKITGIVLPVVYDFVSEEFTAESFIAQGYNYFMYFENNDENHQNFSWFCYKGNCIINFTELHDLWI